MKTAESEPAPHHCIYVLMYKCPSPTLSRDWSRGKARGDKGAEGDDWCGTSAVGVARVFFFSISIVYKIICRTLRRLTKKKHPAMILTLYKRIANQFVQWSTFSNVMYFIAVHGPWKGRGRGARHWPRCLFLSFDVTAIEQRSIYPLVPPSRRWQLNPRNTQQPQ